MKNLVLLSYCFIICLIISCDTNKETVEKMIYPTTNKVDTIDTYFGVDIPDPYRWLENDTSEQTAQWVKAQNKLTFSYLEKIPYRNNIKKRLEKIFNYERLSAPFQHGDYFYFYKNDGLQNQSVLYRKKGEDGETELFLNPNKFKEDGTISLAGISFSKDGSLAAYRTSTGGADWNDVVVVKTDNKEETIDALKDLKFSGIAWKGNEGFYYSTYDKPKGSQLSQKTQFHKLYYHKLGTPQSSDILVFGGEETPRRYIGGYLTEDERFLIISASTSTTGNELYAMDLQDPNAKIVTIVDNFDKEHYVLANEGSRFIIHTNLDASNNRLVEVDFSTPGPEHWKDLIPGTESVLNTSTCGGKIFANYLVDVKTVIKQYDMKGTLEQEIELPAIGTAGGFSGKEDQQLTYYTFTSFTFPPTIYRYNIATGESSIYKRPDIDFVPEDYETKQVFYKSKDGTKVPMFITYKKGIELNGKNPTILYGYGGFNISLQPGFSTSRIVWLENGGIFAQANLRGGGEYGEKWHLAGTKMNKQNVFDDFFAAAEYLTNEKYTSSEFLAIQGGSNGGLLVGATMAQRPELAKVAFPAVGVLDMLRYHKFTAGAGWAFDYGTADDSAEMFEYLRKYSPVHALKKGVHYPATMVTTGDHDDRVVPAHSFKFAATLQERHSGENPVLIRIETDAGHGAGTPISKTIQQIADLYSFAWYNMGYEPPIAKETD